jgi:hypothetical protein
MNAAWAPAMLPISMAAIIVEETLFQQSASTYLPLTGKKHPIAVSMPQAHD